MPVAPAGRRYAYRIAIRRYAHDVSGEGARLCGGRWTPPGRPVLYTAEHPALAGFEKLVHAGIDATDNPLDYRLIVFSIPLESVDRIQHQPGDPVDAGRAWLDAGDYLVLEVPSVVVPYASNLLINPKHPLADEIAVLDDVSFLFDRRL